MTTQNLLLINSSSRIEDSITRKLAEKLISQLQQKTPELNVHHRDLATGLPFIDKHWVAANFTPVEQRSAADREQLNFSDELVKELQSANTIVIASPIYNFSIPAVLKAWIDLVARAQLTFRYTSAGPVGLLENKKVYLLMASGGVEIGSELEFASHYLKHVLSFIGLNDVTIIDAAKVNWQANEEELFSIA